MINVRDDATAFVAWLSKRTGKPYRLPSESERGYVTRAGTTTPYWWGSTIAHEQANVHGFRQQTVLADSFEANPWGLYNVHGNVWEWTEDCGNDSNKGNQRTAAQGQLALAVVVSCAGAPGSMLRGSCAPQTASGTRQHDDVASGWPER